MIAEYLRSGQGNAVPLRHLVKLTGFDSRTVRRLIANERRQGVPILSDCTTGYYLAANDQERAAFVRSMRQRAREILRAADGVESGGAR